MPASSERADVCSNRCIRLAGLPPREAEKIGLLASILGWSVEQLVASAGARRGAADRLGPNCRTDGNAVPHDAAGWQFIGARWAEQDPARAWLDAGDGRWPGLASGAGHIGVPDADQHGPALAGWFAAAPEGGELAPATCSAIGSAPRPGGQPPRLVLRQIGGVIRVQADNAALADQLARQGLDRLVLPVPLCALEELLAFAA